MKGMTPEAMAVACGGKLVGCEKILGLEVTAIVTDSRKVIPGCAFVAIKGARADGHAFLGSVAEAGGMLSVVERLPADSATPCILVDSTLLAIQRIAELYRKNLGIPVVGVTGSVGKTSTKEAIAAVLGTRFRVLRTAGNYNNNLGLPLTIFRLTEEDEVAVLEMGISHFGEMEDLARTARPDVMVITNIGTCHLEFLGSRDGIFRAKTACIPYVQKGGEVVLNAEDDKLGTLTPEGIRELQLQGGGTPQELAGPTFYGLFEGADVTAKDVVPHGFSGASPSDICRRIDVTAKDVVPHGLSGTSFTICMDGREIPVRLALPGRHMVLNALAAAAVGRHFGLSDEEIAEGIASLKPLGGRVNILETVHGTVIDDCYNASPASVKAALDLLALAEGKKTAILGDMGELGAGEKALHKEVGVYAAGLPIDSFLLAGPLSAETAEGIRSICQDAKIRHFPDTEALLGTLPEALGQGPAKDGSILVKASHFMGFDRVVKGLSSAG